MTNHNVSMSFSVRPDLVERLDFRPHPERDWFRDPVASPWSSTARRRVRPRSLTAQRALDLPLRPIMSVGRTDDLVKGPTGEGCFGVYVR